jgi:hypothetical protein
LFDAVAKARSLAIEDGWQPSRWWKFWRLRDTTK